MISASLSGWEDTIVALATPQGIGAIAVIRVSGKQAFELVNEYFPSKKLSEQRSHTLHVGNFMDHGIMLDEVVLSLFKGPRSYTGEDTIEISCHGSPFIQTQILHLLTQKKARLAKPGEFTQRAFLNGKLDLAQAEAVADLIASNTEASRKAAMHTLKGGFSTDLAQLREQLIRFSAMIELELDFAEEDVEFADRSALSQLIQQIIAATQSLLNSFQLGNVIKNGVQVAIIGQPNAGKSTLLNALLNEQRAIVSEIAGTTRDTIEEVLNIDGVLFRLIDTAGIREHTLDVIESIGVAKSYEKMRSANLVLYLFDVTKMSEAELSKRALEFTSEGIDYLLIGNKADLSEGWDPKKFAQIPNIIFISAKTAQNLATLKAGLLAKVVKGQLQTESTIVTNVRHYEALHQLAKSLQEVREGLASKIPGDLLALDIRQCLHYLGNITGQITNDDQLDYIFSKFCIGK